LSNLKIEPNTLYSTRDGRTAYVATVNDDGDADGFILGEDGKRFWLPDGRWTILCEARIDLVERLRPVSMTGPWQPIETAPTNERVLFTDGKEIWISTKYVVDDVVGLKLADHPTHWMPLPEPPKAGARNAETA
jgi:hypothetical protein